MSNNYNLTQLLSFSQRQIAMVVNKLQRADIGSLQRAEAGSPKYFLYSGVALRKVPKKSAISFLVICFSRISIKAGMLASLREPKHPQQGRPPDTQTALQPPWVIGPRHALSSSSRQGFSFCLQS